MKRYKQIFLDLSDKHADEAHVSLDFIQEHDGASHTLMLSENVDAGGWTDVDEPRVGFVWIDQLRDGKPDPITVWRINQTIGKGNGRIASARPSSWHTGGVNVAFCDGHTKFLSENVDYLVFTQLMTPYGKDSRVPGTKTLVAAPYREPAVSITKELDALTSTPLGLAN
jgi:prepilin-type processing-associated H-X9-DG protein